MLRRREPPVSREEIRGALLLLMNIADSVERIRREIVEDDGKEEERR
jgi:hypothetical protein